MNEHHFPVSQAMYVCISSVFSISSPDLEVMVYDLHVPLAWFDFAPGPLSSHWFPCIRPANETSISRLMLILRLTLAILGPGCWENGKMHGQGVYKYCDGLPMPCYIEESLGQCCICCISLGRLGYPYIMTMTFSPLALVMDKHLMASTVQL